MKFTGNVKKTHTSIYNLAGRGEREIRSNLDLELIWSLDAHIKLQNICMIRESRKPRCAVATAQCAVDTAQRMRATFINKKRNGLFAVRWPTLVDWPRRLTQVTCSSKSAVARCMCLSVAKTLTSTSTNCSSVISRHLSFSLFFSLCLSVPLSFSLLSLVILSVLFPPRLVVKSDPSQEPFAISTHLLGRRVRTTVQTLHVFQE